MDHVGVGTSRRKGMRKTMNLLRYLLLPLRLLRLFMYVMEHGHYQRLMRAVPRVNDRLY